MSLTEKLQYLGSAEPCYLRSIFCYESSDSDFNTGSDLTGACDGSSIQKSPQNMGFTGSESSQNSPPPIARDDSYAEVQEEEIGSLSSHCLIAPKSEIKTMSREQLVAEVKAIYAGLVAIETKCIEINNTQFTSPEHTSTEDQFQASIKLHCTNLYELCGSFIACQNPIGSTTLRYLDQMPVHRWKHGIHLFLELLQHRPPDSEKSMLTFIYMAYAIMALVYKTESEDIWVECRGDLARCRKAMEEIELKDLEAWDGVIQSDQSQLASPKHKLAKDRRHIILAFDRALFYDHSSIPLRLGASRKADFSSGQKQYFVKGNVNETPVEASPDSGADMCFISPKLASGLGLSPAVGTQKTIYLANKKHVQSPGMVEVAWRFARERRTRALNCWILPGCVHDLILGNDFLRSTKTLTKFAHRIKSKLTELPGRLQLNLLGKEKQRLWGSLNGYHTAALPDTGSDLMLVSGEYARKTGLTVDRDHQNRLEVEFADGTTDWTSGIVRDIPWIVGGETVRCDFYVLDDLCVDVVLSKDYLFDLNVFSEHKNSFLNTDSEDNFFQLCNIRLIGRYSDSLNVLEEDYLKDVNSPDAFNSEMIQRELARRDMIRDQISALPENEREAAGQAEAERQHRWQVLKQTHQTRSLALSSNTHRTELNIQDRAQASHGLPVGEVPDDGLQATTTRRAWWRKKISIKSIPLESLRRGTGT